MCFFPPKIIISFRDGNCDYSPWEPSDRGAEICPNLKI